MLKSVLVASIVLGSASFACAMPVAAVQTGASLPVVNAAVVVKKVIHRRPARRHVVVKKTIVR